MYDSDGTLIKKSAYRYDKRNQTTEEVQYSSDDDSYIKMIFKYDRYDKKGNWLRKITFEDGQPSMILERAIEYY